ncbi:MAG: hypothetical protein PHX78_04675 [bacterium]|nr:hypothetical protein [bacterium]
MKIIKLEDKDLLAMEQIIIDDDKVEAMKFLLTIQEKIAAEERSKMKSHLDSSDPVKDFHK